MGLKNDQYNQIMREYDNRQLKNKHDQNLRRAEAFNSIPQLKQLEDEMITLSVRIGRMAIYGDQSVEEIGRAHV